MRLKEQNEQQYEYPIRFLKDLRIIIFKENESK